MIKKLSTYIIITMSAMIIGYILAITFKNLNHIYTKVKENSKKVNFLENINNSKNIPSLCFQSNQELAKKTNTRLPEIPPLGSIPFTNKSNQINFDRYGFRNNDDVWNKNNHDYLILGDSVVVDNSISDEYIFSNNFKNKSTINLGCGGNGLYTSLYLLEQIAQTNYNFNEILFFINLSNDFSKDTPREYNTQLFAKTSDFRSKNLFLNKEEYKTHYLKFIKDAFSKDISNFSLKEEFFNEFKIDKYFKNIKINKKEKGNRAALADGTFVDSNDIVEGAYTIEMYNIFLKILERIIFLKQNYNTNITLIFVPTNTELNIYKYQPGNNIDWGRYLNYKYFKNTIFSTVANYNINILDLYYFIKENDYEGFENGHFSESFHKHLSVYIENNIIDKTNKLLQKLNYYNSFYPSKKYFNYRVNFGNKLNDLQVNNWIDTINSLIEKNLIDDYLLTPSLGYFFINQDCNSILKLYNLSKAKLSFFSVGRFFYKTCNLNNSENISDSIREINFLIDKDVKYYIPILSNEIRKSLKLINEN